MVARGDLGVECLLSRIPLVQKRDQAGSCAAKPVIVATQVMDSMIRTAPDAPGPPTTQFLDGADAVMLSVRPR